MMMSLTIWYFWLMFIRNMNFGLTCDEVYSPFRMAIEYSGNYCRNCYEILRSQIIAELIVDQSVIIIFQLIFFINIWNFVANFLFIKNYEGLALRENRKYPRHLLPTWGFLLTKPKVIYCENKPQMLWINNKIVSVLIFLSLFSRWTAGSDANKYSL